MNRILKWIGWTAGTVLVIIVAASIAIMVIVDREFIEEQMEGALNRHVTIKDIDVGIFSAVSGIGVEGVNISNFKTGKQLAALKGKPVAKGDLFVGLESFKFRVSFVPLLKKQFVLKELVLYGPEINVVRDKKGRFNFDDLVQPKKLTKEERAELAKKQEQERLKQIEDAKKGPSAPLSADDIPIKITIGKVGLEDGSLNFTDLGLKQRFSVYDLTALVHSININPDDLDKGNSVKLDIGMGMKTVGGTASGSVKSFDIVLSLNGTVKPFDLKTRLLDPEVSLKAASPRGEVTGLQIFEGLKSVEQLSKYCGKLSFLQDTVKWEKAGVSAWYKGGTLKLSDGKIKTGEFDLDFSGTMNINSMAINYDMDMVLAEKHGKTIRSGIEKNAKKAIPAGSAKIVKPADIADAAMKPLLNEKGRVLLGYKVTGTMSSPKTRLVRPKLPTLKELVSDAAGDAGDLAKKKAAAEVDRQKDAAAKKAGDAAKEESKKAGSKLKKKLKF